MAKQDRYMTWAAVRDLELMRKGNRRIVDEKHVNNIAKNFDRRKLGMLVVAEKNGSNKHAILDGQHRWKALHDVLGMKDLLVPCLVDKTATETKDHAEIFLGLQKRLGVRPVDIFLNEVVAGDPAAVAINEIVKKAGLKVGHGTTDTSIAAVKALKQIYADRGEDGLRVALAVAIEAWGKSAESLHGQILAALGMVLHRYGPKLDRETFTHKLAASGGATALLGKARAQQQTHGSTVPQNAAAIMVMLYNKSRRKGALANWWK